jgi:class 3 adenylate cyclase
LDLPEARIMKVLFVDDDLTHEKPRYLKLPFGQLYQDETEFLDSPVNLSSVVAQNKELRLIILDILWPGPKGGGDLAMGADSMRELHERVPEVPVVIHSTIDNEELLRQHLPEMMRLGAYDWVDKSELPMLRSFRFERAYNEGRDPSKRPASRAILPRDQNLRSDVHVAVMFLDMSGFTALTDQIGAARVVAMLDQFYELVSTEVIRSGGYVDKYIGDAVMAVFGAGAATDDTDYRYVTRAVQTARKILSQAPAFRINIVEPELARCQDQEIESAKGKIGHFRIGLESGPVEVKRFQRGSESEVTFIGRSVNIASRLLGHAQPGELWLGLNAWRNGGRPEGEDLDVAHKNLPGTFKAYQVKI